MKILNKHQLEVPKKYIFLSALLFSLAVILQVSSTEQAQTCTIYIRHIILFTSIYLFWAFVIAYINNLVSPFQTNKNKFTQIIERFISAIILVLMNLIITNLIYYTVLVSFMGFSIHDAYADFKPYILNSFLIRFLDIIIIGIVLKIIGTFQSVQKQKLKVISLENELHLSQLEALRNQLDPHFLFNSLHTLNTLIGYDDKKAKSMVIKVTNLLRKILEKREQQMITFKEELEYFTNYLEIEEERFHDRLEVSISIDENTKEILVPTLILQPLIENSFKHGIAQIEDKGILRLTATLKDDFFIIKLINSIPKSNLYVVTNSTKVGLSNLQQRLQQVYGDGFDFLAEKGDTFFTVTIKINQLL